MKAMNRRQFVLPDKLHNALHAEAKRQRVSASEIVRKMLESRLGYINGQSETPKTVQQPEKTVSTTEKGGETAFFGAFFAFDDVQDAEILQECQALFERLGKEVDDAYVGNGVREASRCGHASAGRGFWPRLLSKKRRN